MTRCADCGVELEPPVRVLHTVYVKKLYSIAGQDYCRIMRWERQWLPGSSSRSMPAPVRAPSSSTHPGDRTHCAAGCTPSPCTSPGRP